MMNWTKKTLANTVEQVVTANTGMTVDQLLGDSKVYNYPGLDEAAELFLSHVKRGSKIVIHGDYDTDGVTSLSEATYLFRSIKLRNAKVVAPGRFSDGYGVNPNHVAEYIKDGFNLLILVDNGIAAVEAVADARAAGMDVIILDHHESRVDENGKVMVPDANVTVDPHITGGDFDDLCGAGIFLRFSEKALDRCNWISPKYRAFILSRLVSFAAIGTVGDMVSLTYDNRKIVKEGIRNMMTQHCTAGLQALLGTFGLEYVTSIGIGFGLSAGINAAGRLEDDGPAKMVRILTYNEECQELTEDCATVKQMNEYRKELVATAMKKADAQMLKCRDDHFIVYYDSTITSGIAGLISGNLTNDWNRPSICLCPDPNCDDNVKGSGRSVEGVDIKGLLDSVNTLLLGYGGHPQACGLTVPMANVDALRAKLNEMTPAPVPVTKIGYDLEATIDGLHDTMKEVSKFEPYGEGNPELIFRIDGIRLGNGCGETFRTMGKDGQHIKLFVEGHDKDIEVVWFSGTHVYKEYGMPVCVDILAKLSLHVFRGNSTLQLQVVDLKPHNC